jgi:hypothetical protein
VLIFDVHHTVLTRGRSGPIRGRQCSSPRTIDQQSQVATENRDRSRKNRGLSRSHLGPSSRFENVSRIDPLRREFRDENFETRLATGCTVIPR